MQVFQAIPNNFQHEFHKPRAIRAGIRPAQFTVILRLTALNEFLNGQPEKQGCPGAQQQGVPHAPHAAIAVCKRMDKFKLVVKHRALDQRV